MKTTQSSGLVVVNVSANQVTLGNGTIKKIPAIFSSYKDEDRQYEAIEKFVRGNRYAQPGESIAVTR